MAKQRDPDGVDVEWDEDKNLINQHDHHVSFEEAATVFNDPLSLAVPDDEHSFDEPRYNIIGESAFGELLVVTYTERGARLRIISARPPTPRERREYHEEGN
jgi:hypothetical protein